MYTERQVFITGGTSGIGAAIARAFAATGASVTATGATAAEVEAAQALPANRLIAFHVLDVRQAEHVKAHVGQFTALDVLVNCAGVLEQGAFAWPRVGDGVMRLSRVQFEALFAGLDWRRIHAPRPTHPTATE